MPENESPTPTVETGEPAALPGLDWRTIDAPGPLGDGTDSRAFGGAGMLLVWDFAAPDQLYPTNGGSTWQQLDLTAVGLQVSTFLLIHGDAGYVALAEGLAEVIAWSSADGIEWQLSESELPYRARSAMIVGDGLAVYSDTGVTVSGLDWGL